MSGISGIGEVSLSNEQNRECRADSAVPHGTIVHFYGHLEIRCRGRLGLTGVECREAAEARREEIGAFCRMMMEESDET